MVERDIGDEPHPDSVCVATGEERGSGGGAHRRDVEPVEAESLRRQPIDVGGLDRRAEAAELPKPGVVEHDDEDVRLP